MPLANAQQDNANFLTHTNTDFSFTIKYPSYWTVDESGMSTNHWVRFMSADGPCSLGGIIVPVQNATPTETSIGNNMDAFANYIISHLSHGTKFLQLDKNGTFFLVILQLGAH